MHYRWKLHRHQNPYSLLDAFAQKLHSSGIPLGRAMQAASKNMANSLSHTESGRVWDTGKFDFGVGTDMGRQGDRGPIGWGSSVFVFLARQ